MKFIFPIAPVALPLLPGLVLVLVVVVSLASSSLSGFVSAAHHQHVPHLHHSNKYFQRDADDSQPEQQQFHECIHDEKVVPSLKLQDVHNAPRSFHPELVKDNPAEQMSELRQAHELAIGPIRFVLRTKALDDPSQFCTVGDKTQQVPDFLGSTVTCSSQDDILTPAKKTILLERLLPAALELLSGALHVATLATPITIASASCKFYPKDDSDASPGISGADFVVYVSATPISGSTVGIGGLCQFLSPSKRPAAGFINVAPKFLTWDDTDANKQRNSIRSVAHELLHALGFSQHIFLQGSSVVAAAQVRGKPTSVVKTPLCLSRYREFTGCSTTDGVELEDQGGTATALSHWERRNLADEIMVGAAGGSMLLSEVTLAVLEDTGFFYPDYGKAEMMVWGKGTGCALLTQRCDEASGDMGTYWCRAEGSVACEYNLRGYGACSLRQYTTAISPSYFQYFSDPMKGGSNLDLMDFCPLVRPYSNARCTDSVLELPESNPKAQTTIVRGETFSSNSRCVLTTGLLKATFAQPDSSKTRCLLMRCAGGNKIQFRLRGQTSWYSCPVDGSEGWVMAPDGFQGKIFCPAQAKICIDKSLFVNDAEAQASPPPAPPGGPTPVPGSGDNNGGTTLAPGSSPGGAATEKAAFFLSTLRPVPPQADFNATTYKTLVEKLGSQNGCVPAASNVSIYVERGEGSYSVFVQVQGPGAKSMAKCIESLDEVIWRASGVLNVTAASPKDLGGGSSDGGLLAGADLSWVPIQPAWIFFCIVGGGILVVIVLACLCYRYKKKSTNEDRFYEQNAQNMYRAFDEAASEEISQQEEMTASLHQQQQQANNSPRATINSKNNLNSLPSAAAPISSPRRKSMPKLAVAAAASRSSPPAVAEGGGYKGTRQAAPKPNNAVPDASMKRIDMREV